MFFNIFYRTILLLNGIGFATLPTVFAITQTAHILVIILISIMCYLLSIFFFYHFIKDFKS